MLEKTISSIFHEKSFEYGKIILPVGISFYTFQTMSYCIDVYNERIKPERHFGIFSSFVLFFPQLVAGPIERADHLLPQIKEKHKFDYEQVKYGLKLMTWGFFKKLVIADNLARHVDIVYSDVHAFKGFALISATVLFAVQIYCDFSGYSDIAIGTADLFGVQLIKNFNAPYLASSLKEFWTRWHISLSTWFRDYVYIPLGGNRRGRLRKGLNLIITFLVSGLWHGANWTFAIWGLLHGVIQLFENLIKPFRSEKKDHEILSITLTFILVCCCWVFFRANSINDAVYVFQHSFDGIQHLGSYLLKGYRDIQMTKMRTVKYLVAVIVLFLFDYYSLKIDVIEKISEFPRKTRWIIYYTLIIFILTVGNFGSNQFVYFQF